MMSRKLFGKDQEGARAVTAQRESLRLMGSGDQGKQDKSPGTTVGSVESMFDQFTAVGGQEASAAGKAPRSGKYDQLWQLSMADPHTGLANKLLLLDRLSQALTRRQRHGGQVFVCHIDLTNLGEINLELGYTGGNEVLCEMARRLTGILRTEDTVGRVGGSELVAVMSVSDEQAVDLLTQRLQATLDDPVMVGGRKISFIAVVGIAVARDSESAEEVLARADRATRAGSTPGRLGS
jgi:diguanylate cyclase (GGDEF)-like protein